MVILHHTDESPKITHNSELQSYLTIVFSNQQKNFIIFLPAFQYKMIDFKSTTLLLSHSLFYSFMSMINFRF